MSFATPSKVLYMRNKFISKTMITRAVMLTIASGFLISNSGSVYADQSSTATYARKPMTSWGSQMNDQLLGNTKYEKPVWNVHDLLGLPDWLELTVDQRTRYEDQDGQFRAKAQGGDQQIALQTDLWLAAHLGKFTIATEFQDARQSGGNTGPGTNTNNLTNGNVDTLDFVQAYASWADKNAFDTNLGAEVKVGRQTLDLGSRRLVARFYYRNTSPRFTGVNIRVLDNAKWQLNTFATMPVIQFPTSATAINTNVTQFDQEATRTWLSGFILEGYNLAANINSELYLYNLDENDSFNNPTRKRQYFTPGLRFYIKPSKGNFDFQAEGMGQFGTVRATTTSTQNLQHEAWSSHVEAGYTFDMPWKPRFSMEYDYATGTNKPGGNTDQRFDPLYGASPVDFGPSAIFQPFVRSNINTPGYRMAISPRPDVLLSMQQRLIWLASSSDCWGLANCTGSNLILNPTGTSGSYVGDMLGFTARYDFNSSLNFESGWYRLFKGQFAKEAQNAPAGQDVDYFYVQSQLRF